MSLSDLVIVRGQSRGLAAPVMIRSSSVSSFTVLNPAFGFVFNRLDAVRWHAVASRDINARLAIFCAVGDCGLVLGGGVQLVHAE
jgi:hypothetical protein